MNARSLMISVDTEAFAAKGKGITESAGRKEHI